MLYALNYSPQAAGLIRSGEITIDRFKCPDWDDLIAAARQDAPPYVHFPILVGGGRVAALDFDRIDHLLATTDTPYVNAHLYPQITDFPDLAIAAIDDLTPAQRERVRQQMHADIDLLVRRFGADRVIVENVPYRAVGEKNLRLSVEPAVMTEMVTTHNVGFLFDISHAEIASRMLGVDLWDYVTQLPLDRLTELHITGVQMIDGQLTDHLHMGEGDWAKLERVLGWIRDGKAGCPWAVAFEYGGISPVFDWRSDADRMRVDVPRMTALVQAASAP